MSESSKPVEKDDAKRVQDQHVPKDTKWEAGLPAEVKGKEGWRLGRYRAFFPQHNYHEVAFADGTSATVSDAEIRQPEGE